MNPDNNDKAILDGLKAVQTNQEKLLSNYENLTGETKKAMEELTKVKNEMNAVTQTVHALQKLQVQLKREERMAFGDPIQRLTKNEPAMLQFLGGLAQIGVMKNASRDGTPYGKIAKDCDEKLKALGLSSGLGATLITDELAGDIYHTLQTFGVWGGFDVSPMGQTEKDFPVQTADPEAYFIDDNAEIPDDTNMTGTTVTAAAKQIPVLINVSNNLLEDATALGARVFEAFARACSKRVDFACLQADGTATGTGAKLDGGNTGIFVGGTAAAAASGNTTVATLDLEDFIKCLTTVDAEVLSRPAAWWLHPQILARAMGVKDSNGRPIFLTSIEAPAFGALGSILGFGVRLANAAPTADTASAKVAVFGDPRGLAVGMRKMPTFASSDQFRFNYNQTSFRMIARAGVKIKKQGAFAMLTLAAS